MTKWGQCHDGHPHRRGLGAATLGLALGGIAAFPVGAAIDKGHGRWAMAAGAGLADLAS